MAFFGGGGNESVFHSFTFTQLFNKIHLDVTTAEEKRTKTRYFMRFHSATVISMQNGSAHLVEAVNYT